MIGKVESELVKTTIFCFLQEISFSVEFDGPNLEKYS